MKCREITVHCYYSEKERSFMQVMLDAFKLFVRCKTYMN